MSLLKILLVSMALVSCSDKSFSGGSGQDGNKTNTLKDGDSSGNVSDRFGNSPGQGNGDSTQTSGNCEVNGETILNGQSKDFYKFQQSANCSLEKETRKCTDGVLDGSSNFSQTGCSSLNSNNVGNNGSGTGGTYNHFKWKYVAPVFGETGLGAHIRGQACYNNREGMDCTTPGATCFLSLGAVDTGSLVCVSKLGN